MSSPDLTVAADAVARAHALGAGEVSVRVSRGLTTELGWRDGRLEKVQESRSLSLRVSLLVEGRFSSHVTNDLRSDAIDTFLARAIDGTRALEPDPDRRLPDRDQMGVNADDLDLVDPQPLPDAVMLRGRAARLEEAVRLRCAALPLASVGVELWSSEQSSSLVCSNGFQGEQAGTQHGQMATLTLAEEGGRRPEAFTHHVVRHHADLPNPEDLAEEMLDRSARRLASRPARSGRIPMLVRNSRVGRLLGFLLTPLSGAALHEGRSCFAGAVGTRLSSAGFTLVDDPLLPRGVASRRFDSDGRAARRLPILEDGVLRSYMLDVYHARKLGLDPTTGTTSNLSVTAGSRGPDEIIASLPQVVLVDGFLGGNVNAATGVYSLGVSGTLYEGGEVAHNVSEMNLSGNLFELLDRYQESASDTWRYGPVQTPSLLFDAMQFAGA